ncbi:hypothetical protein ACQ4PT_068512 [Festuca glaucescens]
MAPATRSPGALAGSQVLRGMDAPGRPGLDSEVVSASFAGSAGPSPAPAKLVPRSGRSSSSPPLRSPPAPTTAPDGPRPRLQSIVVCDTAPLVNASEEQNFPPWELVLSRRGRRGRSPPLPAGQRPIPAALLRRTGAPLDPARAAFLRRFQGRRLRCLSTKHRRAACRDPIRCIDCWAWGHTAGIRCPLSRRAPPSRGPVHERLRFPVQPLVMDRLIASKPAPRRSTPTSSHSIIIASRSMEQQIFNLRSRGVLVTATEARHCANPHLVGQALEKELRLPPHQLRVTRHHPEAFFVLFDIPSHRDRAIALGRLHVDGSTFLL